MKQLVEDGKMGPQFGKLGGRPRKPSVSEAYAEIAREQVPQIKRALRDALDPRKSTISQRLTAAEVLRREEEAQRKREEREAMREESKGGREQMLARLSELLMGDGAAADEFRDRLAHGGAVDVEFEEVEDADELVAVAS